MAMHATRSTSHRALHNMTPGALAFRHDMMFNIPFLMDFITLQHSHQALIDQCVQIANAQRLHHEFQIHDQVLKKSVLSHLDKLVPSFMELFEVIQVHTNGTCTIHLSPNQTECINIHRLKPYKSRITSMERESETSTFYIIYLLSGSMPSPSAILG